jgi:hypothetical protein
MTQLWSQGDIIMDDKNAAKTKTMLRSRGFLPSGGALSAKEFRTISDRGCEDRGAWLEVFCPEDRCLREEERIALVNFCEDAGEKKNLWSDVFCPESSCEIFEASQIP